MKNNNILESKIWFFILFFGIISNVFILFWLLIFITLVVFGEGFKIYNLINTPFLIVPTLIFYVFSSFLKSIYIDEQKIYFNYFFINLKSYKLTYFDYCFTTIERGKNGISEVLYLVKDKKLKARISSGIYKNYDDLKNKFINVLDYKGILELNFSDNFKGFLGKRIENLP